jgi:Nitrogen regulatory protein PII
MPLKELLLIVRHEKSLATEQALLSAGAHYVTRQTVSGRGKEMGKTLLPTWFGLKTKNYGYLRKSMVSAWVPQEKITQVLDRIVQENQTGRYGDGRVFILSNNGDALCK